LRPGEPGRAYDGRWWWWWRGGGGGGRILVKLDLYRSISIYRSIYLCYYLLSTQPAPGRAYDGWWWWWRVGGGRGRILIKFKPISTYIDLSIFLALSSYAAHLGGHTTGGGGGGGAEEAAAGGSSSNLDPYRSISNYLSIYRSSYLSFYLAIYKSLRPRTPGRACDRRWWCWRRGGGGGWVLVKFRSILIYIYVSVYLSIIYAACTWAGVRRVVVVVVLAQKRRRRAGPRQI